VLREGLLEELAAFEEVAEAVQPGGDGAFRGGPDAENFNSGGDGGVDERLKTGSIIWSGLTAADSRCKRGNRVLRYRVPRRRAAFSAALPGYAAALSTSVSPPEPILVMLSKTTPPSRPNCAVSKLHGAQASIPIWVRR
jgi:hypothetical protein